MPVVVDLVLVVADSDGEEFDAAAIAALLADRATLPDGVARLTALGIDFTAAGPVVVDPTPTTGQVLAGFSDVTSDPGDGTRCDVLVLDTGLILARRPEQGSEWRSLSTLSRSGSVALLAARQRFISYDSLASAKVSGWITLTSAITLCEGASLRLKVRASSTRLNPDSDEVLKKRLGAVG